MGAKKKKLTNEGTLFQELAEEINKELAPVDLQSKVREFEAKRNTQREAIQGAAILYDLNNKILSQAEIKNLSPNGVRFEITSVEVKPADGVYVHFSNALDLGMVLCTVQWVSEIAGHRNRHKLVGLKFKNLSPSKQKKLNDFLEKLKLERDEDPFFVG